MVYPPMAVQGPLNDGAGQAIETTVTRGLGTPTVALPQGTAVRPSKTYRGSVARMRKLSVRTHTPASIWIFFAIALAITFLTLACLARFS
jgi:hypothetical protein